MDVRLYHLAPPRDSRHILQGLAVRRQSLQVGRAAQRFPHKVKSQLER